MKASQEPMPFRPVILVLESQAEVDAFYTVTNCPALNRVLGITKEDFKALQPFRSQKTDQLYADLIRLLK